MAQTDTKLTGPADSIYINGNIYSGARLLPAAGGVSLSAQVLPRVQAIAVKNGRVLAGGTSGAIEKFRGRHTQVVDLGGHFVMPGFNDAHVHLGNGALELLNVNLAGAAALIQMQQRIATRVASSSPGEWIWGSGWDETRWSDSELPSRQDLDSITAGHPAIFSRIDSHIAVANTAALRAAGISSSTPDPHGGAIDHDANGEPTGILREPPAMELVTSKVPAPQPSSRRKALELVLLQAARQGVTSLQDNSNWEDFLLYEELEHEGKLTARICEWLPFKASVDLLQEHRKLHPATDAMLHTGMVKAFLDGSLGSRTASLLAPYADDPRNSGLPQYEAATLNRMSDERAAAGFQIGFHAIGDRAVQLALDAFEEVVRYLREHSAPSATGPANSWRDLRFRIEHAQVTAPGQLARFHQLGVIASMQPSHLLTDMTWAEARLGPERAKHSYAWRDFLDNGVLLAFGTDFPVEPITPFRGLYAAVTRQNEAGSRSYYAGQRLTMEEALAAYTWGAAYAEFAERDKGTLQPGMFADFIVLDRDPTSVQAGEVLGTRVLRTVVGGRVVYEAKPE